MKVIEILTNEIWKDVVGYEGRYMVSNLGRVKSLSRLILNGGKLRRCKERILNPKKETNGYHQIRLYLGDNKPKHINLHKIVATAFISAILPDGYHICHINGDKLDNRASNLYIGNVITNTFDKYIQRRTKLSIVQVSQIKTTSSMEDAIAFAGRFGVSVPYVRQIQRGVVCKSVGNRVGARVGRTMG